MNAAASHRRKLHEHGFSLLELAIVLVILGLIGVILVRWYGTVQDDRQRTHVRSLLERSDDALVAFAATFNRLPCPATDDKGLEDCSSPANGFLPWKTIGLPDARAGQFAYGVLRYANPAQRQLDADLTVVADRNRPLYMLAGNVTVAKALGNINGLDFCHALRVAMRLPLDTRFIHSQAADASSTASRNVAYAIAARAPGADISNPNAFSLPSRPNDADYTDQTRVMGVDQLWARLQCSESVASITYSHFNTAVAASMDATSMLDLQKQLGLQERLAGVNDKFAEASLIDSTSGLTSATAGMTSAFAELAKAIANPELKSPQIVSANAVLALSIVATGVAIAGVAKASVFRNTTKATLKRATDLHKRIQEKNGLTATSKALAESLYKRAEEADRRGTRP